MLEEKLQNHAFINIDLDTQLTETELKKANHKVLGLQVEVENKNQYCQEVEVQKSWQSVKKPSLTLGNSSRH